MSALRAVLGRQLALADHAVGALGRRRLRTVTLGLGLAFVVALYTSVLFVTDSLKHEFELGARALPELTVQRLVAGRPALVPVAAAKAIGRIPAVAAARPRVWGYLFVPSLPGNLTVIAGQGDLRRAIARGRALRVGGRGEAVLGEALASFLGLRVGDEIELPGPDESVALRIAGVFRSESALRTADVLLVGEADARAILGVPLDQATDIAVRLTNPDEARVVASKIADQLPGARVLDKSLQRRTYALTFDGRAGLLAAALLPALAALLLLAWDRLTSLGELERREIGLLKTMGWLTRDVLAARVWESLIVSAAGAVLGVAAAYGYVFLARAPGLGPILFGWSSLYPPLDLVPVVDLEQVLAILSGVVVPFVAVSIVPAWRVAVVDPDRSMRGLP